MSSGATEDLIALARGGDDGAYDRLFERVGERLLVFIRCRMGPKLAASLDPLDLLQETYVAAHRSFARFDDQGPGSFTRWLFGIADHRIRDLARHHGAGKRRPPGGALVSSSGALERIRATHTGPATAVVKRERHQRLVEALEKLGDEEREAVLLRYFQGLTLAEVAVTIGKSERAVRRLLDKALGRAGGHLRSGEHPAV